MLLTMLPTVCSQVSPQTVSKTLTPILINTFRNGAVDTVEILAWIHKSVFFCVILQRFPKKHIFWCNFTAHLWTQEEMALVSTWILSINCPSTIQVP